MELIFAVIVAGIIVGIGIVNYRTTIANANARLATRTLQLVFSREGIYGYENSNTGISCSSILDCKNKLNMEIPASFPGAICYNASCAGGCAQATGSNLGGNYSISGTSNSVTAGNCPCPCP